MIRSSYGWINAAAAPPLTVTTALDTVAVLRMSKRRSVNNDRTDGIAACDWASSGRAGSPSPAPDGTVASGVPSVAVATTPPAGDDGAGATQRRFGGRDGRWSRSVLRKGSR